MFHDDIRALTAKKYEILGELELAKAAILREMSTVDKCTLTRLREILDHYDRLEKSVIDKLNTYDVKTNAFIANAEKYYPVYSEIANTLAKLEKDVAAAVGHSTETRNVLNRVKMSYVNAVECGVVANAPGKAHENARVLNDLLANGNIVFLPRGEYFVSTSIVVEDKSGLIGEGRNVTYITATGNFDVVQIPIKDAYVDNHSSVIVKSLTIRGTSESNPAAKGVHVYNDSFVNECGRSATTYKEKFGHLYAFELRNSVIEDLYINLCEHGVYLDNFVAVCNFRNLFICTCTQLGMYIAASDSFFDAIDVTYCFKGIHCIAGCNKFSNVKTYMNGYKKGATADEVSATTGLSFANCHGLQLSNVDVQENYANGVVFDNCHDVDLHILVDANGFNTNTSSNVGCTFIGCYNMSGVLIATNKNANVTQRFGCYCDADCHDFKIAYTESNQQQPLAYAGAHTFNLLTRSRPFKKGTITPTNIGFTGTPILFSDGEFVALQFGFYPSAGKISAGNTIATLSDFTPTNIGNFSVPVFTKATARNGTEILLEIAMNGNVKTLVDITVTQDYFVNAHFAVGNIK